MTGTAFKQRPVTASAAIAIASGAIAVWILLDAGAQRLGLAGLLVGILVLFVGFPDDREAADPREYAPAGLGLLIAITGVLLGGAGGGTAAATAQSMPAMAGLVVLALGLVPLRAGWERRCVTAGATLLLIGVMMAGLVQGPSLSLLLLAGVCAVLAWDTGHHAISIGQQLGRTAETVGAELPHLAGTVGVGTFGMLAALGLVMVGIDGLPMASLLVLLLSVLIFIGVLLR